MWFAHSPFQRRRTGASAIKLAWGAQADTESRDTDYTHKGLSPGTTRHYRVYAINSAGRSVPSNVVRATTEANAPGAPTGLTAIPSGLGETSQAPPQRGAPVLRWRELDHGLPD